MAIPVSSYREGNRRANFAKRRAEMVKRINLIDRMRRLRRGTWTAGAATSRECVGGSNSWRTICGYLLHEIIDYRIRIKIEPGKRNGRPRIAACVLPSTTCWRDFGLEKEDDEVVGEHARTQDSIIISKT
jgi:hypothetical protein